MTPSRYQSAIFQHIGERRGNLAVDAVAGSGKTTTIVKAASLVNADDALFCAFNTHTRDALRSKLPPQMEVLTIHGLGYRTVAGALGRLRQPDSRKYGRLVKDVAYEAVRAVHGNWATPLQVREVQDTLKAAVDFSRLTLTDPSDRAAFSAMADAYDLDIAPREVDTYARLTAGILREGLKAAKQNQEIDFTDMIWLPAAMNLSPRPFGAVFVDEAQDLSAAQLRLVLSAMKPGAQLVAVGDPRQAIYAFAGADARSFQRVKSAAGATELPLSVCYRCPRAVVELAQTIVPHIEPAEDAIEGAVYTVEPGDVLVGAQPGDLLLSRCTAAAIRTCLALLARSRPAKVRGREIGKKMADLIEEVAKVRGYRWETFPEALETVTRRKEERFAGSANAEARIEALRDLSAAVLVVYETASECSSAEDLKARVLGLFADEGRVIWLSTIHRAKGLEEERVWILEWERLPLRWRGQTAAQAEQELNLMYVAVTRAKRELYLVVKPHEAAKEAA